MTPNQRFPLVVILFVIAISGCQANPSRETQKPNIIYIMADDLGYGDLGSYGQQVIKTPNLDRLAASGTRFTNVYTGSTVCAPSRSVLMTGRHTGHTTVRGNFGIGGVKGLGGGDGRVPLAADDTTVAEVLKSVGYVTGMTGKWGLGEPNTSGEPLKQGFDEWFGYLNQRRAHSYYPDYLWHQDERVVLEGNANGGRTTYSHDLMASFVLEFIQKHKDTPFFLYVPFTIPHDRFEVPELGEYAQFEDWAEEERNYAAMVSRMDRDIGRMLELLDSLGLSDDTIIFFCSDNGATRRWEGRFDSSGSLRGRKRDMYEGGIRTPMIVKYPNKIAAGAVDDTPWYFADVLPTLADLAGANTPENIDGISVLPTLLGQDQDLAERVMYWEFYERNFQQAIRMGNWKGVKLSPAAGWELYDLSTDESETNDLADEYPEIAAEMASIALQNHVESSSWPATPGSQ